MPGDIGPGLVASIPSLWGAVWGSSPLARFCLCIVSLLLRNGSLVSWSLSPPPVPVGLSGLEDSHLLATLSVTGSPRKATSVGTLSENRGNDAQESWGCMAGGRGMATPEVRGSFSRATCPLLCKSRLEDLAQEGFKPGLPAPRPQC